MKNGEWENERGNLNGIIYIFLTYCLLCGFFSSFFSGHNQYPRFFVSKTFD